MVASDPGMHLEQVQRGPTSVTIVAREYEADVRVAAKRTDADGVVTLDLREVGGHPLPVWEPGAHVDLILGDAAPTRQYSLCGDPADRFTYRLGVLRDAAGGGGSVYVHDRLAEGDVVRDPWTAQQLPARARAAVPVHRRRHRRHAPAPDGGGGRGGGSRLAAPLRRPRPRRDGLHR